MKHDKSHSCSNPVESESDSSQTNPNPNPAESGRIQPNLVESGRIRLNPDAILSESIRIQWPFLPNPAESKCRSSRIQMNLGAHLVESESGYIGFVWIRLDLSDSSEFVGFEQPWYLFTNNENTNCTQGLQGCVVDCLKSF